MPRVGVGAVAGVAGGSSMPVSSGGATDSGATMASPTSASKDSSGGGRMATSSRDAAPEVEASGLSRPISSGAAVTDTVSAAGEDQTGLKEKSVPCSLRAANSSKVGKNNCFRISMRVAVFAISAASQEL